MNDRHIDRLLDAWMGLGPSSAPSRLVDAVRLEARSTSQSNARQGWPVRRIPVMHGIVRYTLAAALASIAVLVVYAFLSGTPRVGPEPAPSTPTPMPVADAFELRTFSLRRPQGNELELAIELPTDGSLVAQDQGGDAWRFALSNGQPVAYDGTWGMIVADVTDATNHVERFIQDALAANEPIGFLASLAATGSYAVTEQREGEVAGRPAVSARVILRSATPSSPAQSDGLGGYPHVDVDGAGGIMFDIPGRVYLIEVGGRLVLVQVWATTEEHLRAHRLIEDRIVGSLRIVNGP